jgi:hypothetical protein
MHNGSTVSVNTPYPCIGIIDLLKPPSCGGIFLSGGLHPNKNGKKLFANFTAKKLNQLYFSKK